MRRKNMVSSVIAKPEAVQPNNPTHHGLFGMKFWREHMMVEKRWSITSVAQKFDTMANLLSKRLFFERLEYKMRTKRLRNESKNLKWQIREGRKKLSNLMFDGTRHQVHNELLDHKELQRLYYKMPIEMMTTNINQRTFTLRKERDRLAFRMRQLKEKLREKIVMGGELQNRIDYQNEFVLEEQKRASQVLKKISDSKVRLKAITTVNVAYKKMLQVLNHDACFYEPIMRSLTADMMDQSNFIKQVLYMGAPALAKFKELSQQYLVKEEEARVSLQQKVNEIVEHRGYSLRHNNYWLKTARTTVYQNFYDAKNYYERETESMKSLQVQLAAIEQQIKSVQSATLCSRVTEIFPRFKEEMENNNFLSQEIIKSKMTHNTVACKKTRADVLAGILVHNHNAEEAKRMQHIRQLRKAIRDEHEKKASTIKYLKNRSDAFVLLRFALWNIAELLKYVGRPHRLTRVEYSTSYMKLPLLKFEIMTMSAYPPDQYEIRTDVLVHNIKIKLHELMTVFRNIFTADEVERFTARFSNLFTLTMGPAVEDENTNMLLRPIIASVADVVEADLKEQKNVPNRLTIKKESAKFVEDELKKDD